jgi:hypothetical protein
MYCDFWEKTIAEFLLCFYEKLFVALQLINISDELPFCVRPKSHQNTK